MNKIFENRHRERSKRVDRRRRQVRLERLEDRTLLAYTFSVAGTVGAAVSDGVADTLYLVAFGGDVYHSTNGSVFSSDWGGGTTLAVSSNTAINITSSGGSNAHSVNLGFSGLSSPASALLGSIRDDIGGSNSTLVVNDLNNSADSSYTIDSGTISETIASSTVLNVTYVNAVSGIGGGITVEGGSGNSTYSVVSTLAGQPIALVAGAGVNSFNVASTAASGTVSINGAVGTNSVVLGGVANVGAQQLQGAITLTGSVALTVNDSADTTATTAVLSGTQLTGLAPITIDFTGATLTSLTIDGGSAGNTFTVSGTPADITTNLNTGVGVNTVNVQTTSPGSTLNIDTQGGSSANTVTLGGVASVGASSSRDDQRRLNRRHGQSHG